MWARIEIMGGGRRKRNLFPPRLPIFQLTVNAAVGRMEGRGQQGRKIGRIFENSIGFMIRILVYGRSSCEFQAFFFLFYLYTLRDLIHALSITIVGGSTSAITSKMAAL